MSFQNRISNQVINYQGWFNGGYYQDVANKVKVISKLGGKSALESLRKNRGSWRKIIRRCLFPKVTWISKRYKYATESVSKYYSSVILSLRTDKSCFTAAR